MGHDESGGTDFQKTICAFGPSVVSRIYTALRSVVIKRKFNQKQPVKKWPFKQKVKTKSYTNSIQ